MIPERDIAIDGAQMLVTMTVGELNELIRQSVAAGVHDALEEMKEPERLDGVQAIIEYLGMAESTFYKFKAEGVFDGAIHQKGRTVMAWKQELDKVIQDRL